MKKSTLAIAALLTTLSTATIMPAAYADDMGTSDATTAAPVTTDTTTTTDDTTTTTDESTTNPATTNDTGSDS